MANYPQDTTNPNTISSNNIVFSEQDMKPVFSGDFIKVEVSRHERTQPTQSIQPLTQDTFWFKMVSLHILIQPYQLICILWVYNQFCLKTYHQWVQRFETIQITIWKIATFRKRRCSAYFFTLQCESKLGSSANPRYGAAAPRGCSTNFSGCNPKSQVKHVLASFQIFSSCSAQNLRCSPKMTPNRATLIFFSSLRYITISLTDLWL